jgi:hypothetical protein
MEVIKGKTYETDVDLVRQDLYHMLKTLGTNVTVLIANHQNERAKYLIVVNTETGESFRIVFGESTKA